MQGKEIKKKVLRAIREKYDSKDPLLAVEERDIESFDVNNLDHMKVLDKFLPDHSVKEITAAMEVIENEQLNRVGSVSYDALTSKNITINSRINRVRLDRIMEISDRGEKGDYARSSIKIADHAMQNPADADLILDVFESHEVDNVNDLIDLVTQAKATSAGLRKGVL